MNYFNENEFVMGTEIVYDKMNPNFLLKLDNMRQLYGKPMRINSSYRSPEYNEKVGGSKNSMHMKGVAVDIHCDNGVDRALLVTLALAFGFSVGIAKTFIHVDDRRDVFGKEQVVFSY